MLEWMKRFLETTEETKARHVAERKAQAKADKAEVKRLREEAKTERILRRAEKIQALKERKAKKRNVEKAKAFVRRKGLRKVRRNGSTVFVNDDGNIVNYAILAYLLLDHGNGNSYSESYTPSYSSGSSYSDDSSSSSDWGGSFSGGDSGGGGASGDW